VLAQRVASAAVGVPVIVLLIILGGNWYVAAVAAALAIAAVEFQHMRRDWLDPACLLTGALVAGIAVGAHVGTAEWAVWLVGAAVLAPLASLTRPATGDTLMDALWTLGAVTYVGFLGSFIVLLRDVDFDARSWVFLAVFATFATDTGAFFTGRAIGRHLLAPRISPKKTIEGFFGGCAAGFGAVVLLAFVFELGVEPWKISLLGLLLPPVAALGDLAESGIKRLAHVKDASELIPGHGGVLDRLDSILLTLTLVYLFTEWVVY
jgi:phosphatidate cytidylyltransferase